MLRELLTRPVAFHPALARLFGGVNEALLWQQINYWSDKGRREDGWIYKTKEELEEETTLTRDQQDRARKNLEKLGVLETKLMKADGAPTLHYKVDHEQVIALLSDKSDKRETSDPISGKPANPLYTESTTHTFSKNKFLLESERENEDDYSVVSTDDWGEELKPKQKRDLSYRKVYSLWSPQYNGAYPTYWNVNPHIKASAERLLSFHGFERVKRAFDFYWNHRHEQFCPKLSTPKDLEEKWDRLLSYKHDHKS